ncbi:uncharacterized protein LOC134542092 isoform X1 [Bacillus rossius redtenbacheri]|uniref:uncharacterized protein LOC134529497 isoform X1 n=1 Tax=Bacillus rossius redtenbacheri TaxID=93214 RepID=UPI002FDED617
MEAKENTCSAKKPRNKNLSPEEKIVLLDLVTEHFNIIENKRTDAVTQQNKLKQWQIIASSFNCVSGVHHRSADNLKSVWENLKKTTRKQYADEKVQMVTGTGMFCIKIFSTCITKCNILFCDLLYKVKGSGLIYFYKWQCTLTINLIKLNTLFFSGGGPPTKCTNDPILGRVYTLIKPVVKGHNNIFDSDSDAVMVNTLQCISESNNTEENAVVELEIGSMVDIATLETQTSTLLNGDWSHYTPSMLRGPICPALVPQNNASSTSSVSPVIFPCVKETVMVSTEQGNCESTSRDHIPDNSNNVAKSVLECQLPNIAGKSSWTQRRRPKLQSSKNNEISALHKAKIELIELCKKYATEENEAMKELRQVRLQQEQERLNHEKLQTEFMTLQIKKLKKELDGL